MLQSTFLHIDGIGPVRETAYWRNGIRNWSDLACSPRTSKRVADEISLSLERLGARDASFFGMRLTASGAWRLYPDFVSETCFLDIETTGISRDDSYVTVAGVLDSNGYRAYIRGDNLDELPQALSKYRTVVTFNGAAFDLPFLKSEMGQGVAAQAAHIDLRHVLQAAGRPGPLKLVERRTGTGRPSVLANLSGRDAVRLWRMADEGEPGTLRTLTRYNAEDVTSLPKLMQFTINELAAATPLAQLSIPNFPPFDTTALPYDRSLVEYLGGASAYRC